MSREAEGQQGAEQPAALEKFSSVGRSSLDMFSPTREGEALPASLILSFSQSPPLICLHWSGQTLGPPAWQETRPSEGHTVRRGTVSNCTTPKFHLAATKA